MLKILIIGTIGDLSVSTDWNREIIELHYKLWIDINRSTYLKSIRKQHRLFKTNGIQAKTILLSCMLTASIGQVTILLQKVYSFNDGGIYTLARQLSEFHYTPIEPILKALEFAFSEIKRRFIWRWQSVRWLMKQLKRKWPLLTHLLN